MTRSQIATVLFAASLLLLDARPGTAEQPQACQAGSRSAVRPLRSYRTGHLQLRTDLPVADADALFARLKRTLKFATRYWGRDPRGRIRCFVVDDLDNWTDAQLPHRLARVIIHGVGGATIPQSFHEGGRTRTELTVYAASRPGVAEHELIHAYCAQTFGSGGPEWYKEGMAEVASCGSTRSTGMRCSPAQSAALRKARRTSVGEVLSVGSTGARLSDALTAMMADPVHAGRHVALTAWTQLDTDNVAQARDEYLRSWALCYMLLHNPNYSKRFRSIGPLMVTKRHQAFEDLFRPVEAKIAFEYRFLLEHFVDGFRADLSFWDWDGQSQLLGLGKSHSTRVAAARGFQASGVDVGKGHRYRCRAEGRWSTCPGQPPIDANGRADHSGRLVGVIMHDYQLSAPFQLGTNMTFRAPMQGRLFLRCNDAWNALGDNRGTIRVRLNAE